MEDNYRKMLLEETSYYNKMLVPGKVCEWLPHFFCSWLRSCLGAVLLYSLTTLLCLHFWKRYASSPKEDMPSRRMMMSQAIEAVISIPFSTFFSTIFEWLAENGWTRCYPRIKDVGWTSYVCYTLLYLLVVDFGIYWAHRLLHEIKPLYKYFHEPHHRIRKEFMLSPFSGWSGHPMDGAIQELPLGLALFLIPVHFKTFIALFLVEAIWGVTVHDRSEAKTWPIMGSDYHTIHHTLNYYNFGNFTIAMDWLFGTLHRPKLRVNPTNAKQ